MKKTNLKNIAIGFNCSKDYNVMSSVPTGKYCSNCQKTVTDFTKYTENEIIEYFEGSRNKKCGRFSQGQLVNVNNAIHEANRSTIYPYLKTGILASTILASSCSSNKELLNDCAQHDSSYEVIQKFNSAKEDKITVKGTIVDESNIPLIGVTYEVQNDKMSDSHTNIDGEFQFEVDTVNIDKSEFEANYIGYQSIKIKMAEIKNQEIKIVLRGDTILLGDIIVERQPLHKRIWNGIANIFR